MKCRIVVAVDIAKMENAFACKVLQGNSVNKVINNYKSVVDFIQCPNSHTQISY